MQQLCNHSTWMSAARLEWVHNRILWDLSSCTKRRTHWLRVNVFPAPKGPNTTRRRGLSSREAILLMTFCWFGFKSLSRSHCQRIFTWNFKIPFCLSFIYSENDPRFQCTPIKYECWLHLWLFQQLDPGIWDVTMYQLWAPLEKNICLVIDHWVHLNDTRTQGFGNVKGYTGKSRSLTRTKPQ